LGARGSCPQAGTLSPRPRSDDPQRSVLSCRSAMQRPRARGNAPSLRGRGGAGGGGHDASHVTAAPRGFVRVLMRPPAPRRVRRRTSVCCGRWSCPGSARTRCPPPCPRARPAVGPRPRLPRVRFVPGQVCWTHSSRQTPPRRGPTAPLRAVRYATARAPRLSAALAFVRRFRSTTPWRSAARAGPAPGRFRRPMCAVLDL
jgi:hypothetical protein